MKKKISIAVGFLALGLLSSALLFALHNRFFPSLLKVGERLPALHVRLVRGADTASLASRRAFIVYKSGCIHCQRTIRNLANLYRVHSEWASGSNRIAVELIEVSGSHATVSQGESAPFNFYEDEHGETLRAMKGSLVPYIVLVDEKDVVRYSRTGELTSEQEEKLWREFYQIGKIL